MKNSYKSIDPKNSDQIARSKLITACTRNRLTPSALVQNVRRLKQHKDFNMEPDRDHLIRVAAPRPAQMSRRERIEYAQVDFYVSARRRSGERSTPISCRFYNTSQRSMDVIWIQAVVSSRVSRCAHF